MDARSLYAILTCRLSSGTFRSLVHRASERIQEIRYGIKTTGWVSEEKLGFTPGDGRLHYTALPYASIKRLLSTVAPNSQKDVFVDWGSGMGRVLVLASAYPYRKVLGVEYSPDLCAAAERNLNQARVKRRCGSIGIINVDAREFLIPEDSSVMFFFNPFRGDLLTEVVRHIRDSWITHRRPITFLVSNHASFISSTGSEDWLKPLTTWQALSPVELQRVPLYRFLSEVPTPLGPL